MGGAWSGSRWRKKRTVENCYTLDTANLKRLKLLAPCADDRVGVLRWMRGSYFEVRPGLGVAHPR